MTLRALQSSANYQDTEAPMTWRALNVAGQSSGSPMIDYERFAARYDAEGEDGILHQLVDRFDDSGIVIKTSNGQDPEVGSMPQEPEAQSSISTMAKHAISPELK